MRTRILISVSAILFGWTPGFPQHRYPVEDFHHRNITVPMDHFNKDEGTFSLYYELSSNFRFDQPTIFRQAYTAAAAIDASALAQQGLKGDAIAKELARLRLAAIQQARAPYLKANS